MNDDNPSAMTYQPLVDYEGRKVLSAMYCPLCNKCLLNVETVPASLAAGVTVHDQPDGVLVCSCTGESSQLRRLAERNVDKARPGNP